MSLILLNQEFVSPNEAYITWTVDSSVVITASSKGFLYLTDITPERQVSQAPGVNVFPIFKYQLRSGEISGGSHIFDELIPGQYITELSIITGNTSISSDTLTVDVYSLGAPLFDEVIPSNTSFRINLVQPAEDIQSVTFILLSKTIMADVVQSNFSNSVTICLPYDSNNSYIVTNVINDVEYEIACFYTDVHGISSVLSETLIKRPTATPNQITTLAAIYDSVGQKLTITHNMPSNEADNLLVDCRATITDTSNNNVTYYLSSENSALLDPAPTAASDVVFNLNNQSLLPVDVPFTITLSVKNELGFWGPLESPALYCIHTGAYKAHPLEAADLSYSVGLQSISTQEKTDRFPTHYQSNIKPKESIYDINYTAEVFECDASGAIVGSAIDSSTQINDIDFTFNNLTTGSLYKLVINLKYVYTFTNNTTATIDQQANDTCFYYFIPHDVAEQLSLSATPSDESVYVSWSDITASDLKGFILGNYEVSDDDIVWTSTGSITSYTFNGLTNGSSNTFYARAVSVSGSTFYMSGESVTGQTASITSIPYGNPNAPELVSKVPGDTKCTVVCTLSIFPDNGGLFNRFQASVNQSSYNDVSHDYYNDDEYTFVFENLTNLDPNFISIRLVTNNQANTDNINTEKYSAPLTISTTPFKVPSTPTGIIVRPSTNAVELEWDAASPAAIINNNVKYELHYKLESDSVFTIVSDITTNTYNVVGLISNSMYVFKIQSTIYNNESSSVYKSEFTTEVQGRPFIYLNAPLMNLVAGNETITVKLSPNVNNYFPSSQSAISFKYTATITDNNDVNNTTTKKTLTVSDNSEQSILFEDLPPNFDLINLSQYTIVAYYEMLNTDNQQYYSSDTTTNQIKPYNPLLAPELTSVSGNKKISLTVDIENFTGYTIDHYEVSFDNIVWNNISVNSTANSNKWTADITQQNGTDLENGTEYELYARVVYNVNGINYDSLASNKVTNIPYTNSSAPTSIQSTPADTKVTVSWSAPVNLGGLDLDYYEVKVNNAPNWESVQKETSKIFDGLTNGQPYTFYVRAVTINVLEGGYVNGEYDSVINIPYKPASAPVLVSYLEKDGELVLSWSQPLSLGGLQVDHYEVSRDNVTWVDKGSSTTHTFDGLTNGDPYVLRVKAYTTHAYLLAPVEGDTLETKQLYPYKAASAPESVSCVEGDESLLLTWAQPSELNGLQVDHYEVSRDNVTWVDKGLTLSHTFNQLTNGSEYILRVKAYTTHPNLSAAVEGATFVTGSFYPYKAASAPESVSCVEGDESLLLTWAQPLSLGGLQVDHYEVSRDNVTWVDKGLTLSHTFDQLTNGSEYILRVKAYTTHPNLGSIEGITFVTGSFYPYKAASAPESVSCVEGDESLLLTWSEPSELNGLQVDHYEVSRDNVTWVDKGLTLSHTFDQLTNGSEYILRVKAYTTHPNLGSVEGATFVTGSFVPYKRPAATTITSAPDDGFVDFTWTDADLIIDGLPFAKYQVSTDDVIWDDNNSNGYRLNGNNGIPLTLYVRVVTTHRTGLIYGFSASNTNIPYAKAKPVDHTSYTAEPGNGNIIFSWTPVPSTSESLGGLTFDHYEVSKDQGANWISAGNNINVATHTFNNLVNGTEYKMLARVVTIHTYSGVIIGEYDINNNIYDYPFDKAAAPTNIVATISPFYNNVSVNLSWTPVTDLGGLSFLHYLVSKDGNNWEVTNTITNSYMFTGLTNGEPYNFNIAAVTQHPKHGEKEGKVGSITNIIPYSTPTAPVIQTNIGDRQIELTWNTPDLGGLNIHHYELSYNGSAWYNLSSNTNSNIVYITSVLLSSVTFTGLTNGNQYTYYIRAVTTHTVLGSINGDSSDVSSGTPFAKPGLVSNIVASVTNNVLRFSFTGPVDANNNVFLQEYEYSIDNNLTFTSLYGALSANRDITTNTSFTLGIRCYIMDPNNTSVRVTGDIEELRNLQNVNISTPQNLQATVGNGTVTLTWDSSLVSGYSFQVIRYFPNGSTFKAFTSNNSYTFSGLTNGTSYQFGVNIYNNNTNTAGSVSNITATPASAPVINSVSKSGDVLSLNINFGGSSKINIDFGAFYVNNGNIESQNVSRVVTYSPSVNPITFSGMASYTYFNITVSNLVGSVSGNYSV